MKNLFLFLIITAIILANIMASAGILTKRKFEQIKTFDIPESRQGIAVDDRVFFAIGTREIGKYDKETGKLIKKWKEKENGPIIHLDSGVIVDGKLYCAHSNYPGIPMTSSIEVWDPSTLEHIESHSFGIFRGSCTWVDQYKGFWWGAFAHYDKWKAQTLKGTEWTTVVKFDKNWNELESWVFPKEIVDCFRPMSNSGGSWGPDGYLYCTGHDQPKVYLLKIPTSGSQLELVDIVPINNTGQGIAWDRNHPGIIYTIKKQEKKVTVSKLIVD